MSEDEKKLTNLACHLIYSETGTRLLRSESGIKLCKMTENKWKEILKRMGNT